MQNPLTIWESDFGMIYLLNCKILLISILFQTLLKKHIERTFLNMLFIYLSEDAKFSYTMIDVESCFY